MWRQVRVVSSYEKWYSCVRWETPSGNLCWLWSLKCALFSQRKNKGSFQKLFCLLSPLVVAKASIHFSSFKTVNYHSVVKGIDSVHLAAMAAAITDVKRWSKKTWKKYPKALFSEEDKVICCVTTAKRTCPSSFHVCHLPCTHSLLWFSCGTHQTCLWSDLAIKLKASSACFFVVLFCFSGLIFLSVTWIGSGIDPISSQASTQ